MTDKMREEFEDWYMRIRPHIHYMVRTPTDGYANRHAQELWGIWQAAKSVPVVGEVVAWRYEPGQFTEGGSIGHLERMHGAISRGYEVEQLVVQPTHSISAAELERLRKDAESYRRLVDAARAEGMRHCTYPDCICPDGISTGSCNILS